MSRVHRSESHAAKPCWAGYARPSAPTAALPYCRGGWPTCFSAQSRASSERPESRRGVSNKFGFKAFISLLPWAYLR